LASINHLTSINQTIGINDNMIQEGAGVCCILKYLKGTNMLISCKLEFPCTKNTIEYEALVQEIRKATDLKAEKFKVFSDFEIIVR
jgi:ribonuclease HI